MIIYLIRLIRVIRVPVFCICVHTIGFHRIPLPFTRDDDSSSSKLTTQPLTK